MLLVWMLLIARQLLQQYNCFLCHVSKPKKSFDLYVH